MERVWDAARPVDLRSTLGPLRRGSGDPAHRIGADGRFWWACTTPDGAGTIALHAAGSAVTAEAWGAGARWLLDRVPTLLGADDDWGSLDVASMPLLDRVRRARPGLRLPSTGLVLDSLVPAILEQKVTGREAWRSWQQLVHRFGEPAPGPNEPLRVPPTPRALLDIPTWDWHRIGVDLRRQRTIRAVASVAGRLEECATLPRDVALARLRHVPGIGPWTAAETVQRALGDPDTVSIGDYHLPNVVVHLFTGRPRGTDDEMLELLVPWAGQRQRVMRLVEAAGIGAPRFGPRFTPLDARAI
jgi:3-methyladenine DNA glycosylase/8-oxoguanine DNA glycosylase